MRLSRSQQMAPRNGDHISAKLTGGVKSSRTDREILHRHEALQFNKRNLISASLMSCQKPYFADAYRKQLPNAYSSYFADAYSKYSSCFCTERYNAVSDMPRETCAVRTCWSGRLA